MKMNDLKSASECADRFGVKALVYGPARIGKTRLVLTAPNPVMIAIEQGTLSLSDGDNIPCKQCLNSADIDDFFKWVFGSNEIKNFDTLFIDSASALSEVFLIEELNRGSSSGKQVHGEAAYGAMAKRVLTITDNLTTVPDLNVILIAKEEEGSDNVKKTKRPWFEGRMLDKKIPFSYDEILRLDLHKIPGVTQPTLSLKCKTDYGEMAGDRSGKLDEYEPPDLSVIIEKCLS